MSKEVISNDFMYMNYVCSKAIIENNKTLLDNSTLEKIIANADSFDAEKFNHFKDLYFSDNDLLEILKLRESINNIENENEKRIAIHSLVRACIKKRPR
jgi:DNA adenine methylase